MKHFLGPLAILLANYAYTVRMGNLEEGIYVFTNLIASICWVILGCLIYYTSKRYNKNSMIFTWVRPFTISLKIFAGLSALRFALNVVVIPFPVFLPVQAIVFILHMMALAVAVGYGSVYYRRIPDFLARVARHQVMSRRFEKIADAATDGFIETDEQGIIWFANPAAHEIFRYEPRGLFGREIVALMPEEFRPRHLAEIKRYLDTHEGTLIGRKQPTELSAIDAKGNPFPIELTLGAYEVLDQTRFVGIVRDISYRKQLENQVLPATGTGPVTNAHV